MRWAFFLMATVLLAGCFGEDCFRTTTEFAWDVDPHGEGFDPYLQGVVRMELEGMPDDTVDLHEVTWHDEEHVMSLWYAGGDDPGFIISAVGPTSPYEDLLARFDAFHETLGAWSDEAQEQAVQGLYTGFSGQPPFERHHIENRSQYLAYADIPEPDLQAAWDRMAPNATLSSEHGVVVAVADDWHWSFFSYLGMQEVELDDVQVVLIADSWGHGRMHLRSDRPLSGDEVGFYMDRIFASMGSDVEHDWPGLVACES